MLNRGGEPERNDEPFHESTVCAEDAIVMLDDTGSVLHWSPAAEAAFGYLPKEAMGKPFQKLLSTEPFFEAYKRDMADTATETTIPPVAKSFDLIAFTKDP
jgi:PAS domain S-box-containing protein